MGSHGLPWGGFLLGLLRPGEEDVVALSRNVYRVILPRWTVEGQKPGVDCDRREGRIIEN
jgi:hypothetical protein